jgi:uncharacterized protein
MKTVTRNTPTQHQGTEGICDRRSFLKGSTAMAGLSAAASFQALLARPRSVLAFSPDYGPLSPTLDEATGLDLLKLPEGFRYISFGWTGDVMDDGLPTPPAHDGMAVVAAHNNRVVLVRNHEVRGGGTAFGPAEITYDAAAPGGTTNLVFHIRGGKWLKSSASISGTSTNCAGGSTPWGSWLTCEETVEGPPDQGFTETHGWVFDVPGFGSANPVPLTAMGRFAHEAVAVDPVTGIVYETEDSGTAGFYRFIPNRYSRLEQGGQLQMLRIQGSPNADLSQGVGVGAMFDVAWVNIAAPESLAPSVYEQGLALGGATFRRLEGCWYDSGKIFFTSTSGGAAEEGQVWEYDPRREKLTLIFESPHGSVLNNPDNITVSPRGGILLCEDGGGGFGDRGGERLIGLTPAGEIFPFAENNIELFGTPEARGLEGNFRNLEWAGATYDPTGRWLFVNIQTPGITFAITGPWNQGVL